METARMNYYFTGIIILMLTALAFCTTPAYPRNEYLNSYPNECRTGEVDLSVSARQYDYDNYDSSWNQSDSQDVRLTFRKYLFTVDFAHPESNILDTDHSEIPHEHKCAHIIELDDGNYAAQPNNRCIWDIPSFTVKDDIPDWKVQTSEWNVEDSRAWRTEDTDRFFYEIEEKKND